MKKETKAKNSFIEKLNQFNLGRCAACGKFKLRSLFVRSERSQMPTAPYFIITKLKCEGRGSVVSGRVTRAHRGEASPRSFDRAARCNSTWRPTAHRQLISTHAIHHRLRPHPPPPPLPPAPPAATAAATATATATAKATATATAMLYHLSIYLSA